MKAAKQRVFEIIEIGNKGDFISAFFDAMIVTVIVLNLAVTIFATFEESKPYADIISTIEFVTIVIFAIEYVLRLWTAECMYPDKPRWKAVLSFAFSIYGLIDFFTFFPYFLPFVMPAGMVAFRMLRGIRIFRLFKINARYDAFNVITDVIYEKRNQIISSMCLILMFMIASSLCMYGLEHDAQPESFQNAFSGIWWAVSALLTVGYGDIYPITVWGRIMAIVISFLGVGMVAIPTGIISAGFVEQYTKLKMLTHHSEEHELNFVTSVLDMNHPWQGKQVRDIVFPPQLILMMIIRGEEIIVPNGETILRGRDRLVIAAKDFRGEEEINLREIIVKEEHEWVGRQIRDLDISRQELIVMIRRKNRTIIPNGSNVIKTGDIVIMYSKLAGRD